MTTWHEERLLIDGELVAGRRTARPTRPSRPRPRRSSVWPPTRPSTTRGARSARPGAPFDTTRLVTRPRVPRAVPPPAPPGPARQRRAAARDPRARGRRAGLEHERSAARGPDRRRGAGTPTSLEGYDFVEDLGERDTFAGRHHRWIEKEAAGVVGAITAYNYPIQLALAKLAPGARGRVHGRAQGRARHAVGDARARQAHRRGDRHPAGRRERAQLVRQRRRRRADDASRRRRRLVHRLDARRPPDHGRRRARP